MGEKRNVVFGVVFFGYMAFAAALTLVSKSFYRYHLPSVTVMSPEKEGSASSGAGQPSGEREGSLSDTRIPTEALRRDDRGCYVLALHEDDGVLGVGYKAVRISVDVLETDGRYCSVEGIPEGELVIVGAAGEISDGDSVCYEGG